MNVEVLNPVSIVRIRYPCGETIYDGEPLVLLMMVVRSSDAAILVYVLISIAI